MLIGFVYSEKSEGIISQLQPEDVTFTIRVEDIPRQVNLSPFVIQAQDERHQDVKKIKLEKREPHLPRFKYPVHNQSISPGDTVRISFVDGELDTQQAQFVLREKGAPPGVNDKTLAGPGSIDSNFSFVDYSIVTDLIFPSSTTSGPHTLVARELYPNSTKKTLEVASVDVIISPNMPAEGELPKIKRQSLNEFQASLGKFEKRAPHLPFFRLPIENQTFITGHHINILLEDGLPSKVARFLIRKKFPTEEDKDLVLYGKNCSSEGFFFFKNYTVKARVLLPQLVPNGTYYLIAQEKFNKKSKKVFEVKSLEIQVEREEFFASSSPDPTSSGITKIVKGPVLAAVNTSIKDAVTKKLSPTRHRAPPHRIRLSPSIISPTGAQDVPIGSQFECKVQDSRATSEIAQFVLRNQNGKEFYLGSASFKRGVAIAKVNCPKQLKFDSYTVVARVNSLDKPKTFLDAISVTILVTHSQNVLPSLVSASKKLEKRDTEVSKLYKPYWNQVIAPGKQFECNITDKTTKATTVKYCIRYDDGRSDLYVGQADIKNGVGATYCKVPSSQVAGTYMFVAQENIPSSPKKFRDVQSILITLSIPKNYRNVQHQSLLEQQDEKVVGINFNSRASAINSNLKDPMQSFTLLNPMPNQILVRGEIFAVELENSNLTYSSLMKFVLRPEITSNLNQAYELGVSSRGSEKLDARFLCPEVVPSGAYNFVVQESDLNDPTTYRDVTTIRVLVVNNKKEGEIKARGDDFE
ncbi:expressed protein [Phakopsora pachyrhizi]|uniref:Expressed protein n=1 Tax=Phakopsora pachyrhizi TaxID=170000 RepID=A0AAV0AP59_PHAPC|nr:expressed protein [Phakopsora pachyrhizi]